MTESSSRGKRIKRHLAMRHHQRLPQETEPHVWISSFNNDPPMVRITFSAVGDPFDFFIVIFSGKQKAAALQANSVTVSR